LTWTVPRQEEIHGPEGPSSTEAATAEADTNANAEADTNANAEANANANANAEANANANTFMSAGALDDTDFHLRYAARILERYARLWHRIGVTSRFLMLFSGTSAFGALVSESQGWTIAAGLVFAALQAAEFAFTPAQREHQARAARSLYLEVLAKQGQLTDAELKTAYDVAAGEDPIMPPDSLRQLAYNDIAAEVGADPKHFYPRTRYLEFVDWVA
jgi:hypothetical protein